MNAARCGLLLLGIGFVVGSALLLPAADDKPAKDELRLKMRSRPKDRQYAAVEKTVTWKAADTALVVCDM